MKKVSNWFLNSTFISLIKVLYYFDTYMINILSIYVQGRISGVGRKSRTLLYRCSASKEFVICAIISVVLLYCLLVVGRLARQGPLRQQLKVNKCSQERCTLAELSVISDRRTDGRIDWRRVALQKGVQQPRAFICCIFPLVEYNLYSHVYGHHLF